MNFKDLELTLLSEGEVFGVDGVEQLEVLKKYGIKSAVTDLAILTGCYLDRYNICMVPDDNSLKGIAGNWGTKSPDGDGGVIFIDEDGENYGTYCNHNDYSIRPVLIFSSSSVFQQITSKRISGYNGTEEIEFGEYSQYVADVNMQEILENAYKNEFLYKTGRNYTFDSRVFDERSQCFKPITYDEYEYNGKKYIRVKANSIFEIYSFELSNGSYYKNGDYVWVEVSPVIWLIDDKTKMLVSKRGLVSGISLQTKGKIYYGDFATTEMKEYLDKYMLRDLFQSVTLTNTQDITSKDKQFVKKFI